MITWGKPQKSSVLLLKRLCSIKAMTNGHSAILHLSMANSLPNTTPKLGMLFTPRVLQIFIRADKISMEIDEKCNIAGGVGARDTLQLVAISNTLSSLIEHTNQACPNSQHFDQIL